MGFLYMYPFLCRFFRELCPTTNPVTILITCINRLMIACFSLEQSFLIIFLFCVIPSARVEVLLYFLFLCNLRTTARLTRVLDTTLGSLLAKLDALELCTLSLLAHQLCHYRCEQIIESHTDYAWYPPTLYIVVVCQFI